MSFSLHRGPALGLLVLGLTGVTAQAASREVAPALPAWFEKSGDAMVARGSRGALRVDSAGAHFTPPAPEGAKARTFRLTLAGGAQLHGPAAVGPKVARTSYFVGRNRSEWRAGLPQFEKAQYRDVYPGIDWVFYTTAAKRLEYDFVVQPGADPNAIRVKFDPSVKLSLEQGTLVARLGESELRQPEPLIYQRENGQLKTIAGAYRILPGNEIAFEVSDFDRSKPLVIDPVLTYSAYFGGGNEDRINAIAVDSQGNLWATGSAGSEFTPPQAEEPYRGTRVGAGDAFIARFTPNEEGKLALTLFTYLGGAAIDEGNAIAVDSQDRVYVVGTTASNDFPLAGNAHQTTPAGGWETFVSRFDPQSAGAESLFYSSYQGGPKDEYVQAIAVDATGAVHFCGFTDSGELGGATEAVLQRSNRGGIDAFYARVQPNAPSASAAREYATFLGGNGTDSANAIVVDSDGVAYLTGYTTSDDFPIAGLPYQDAPRSRGEIMLARIDTRRAGLDALTYSSYIGGGQLDVATAMARDAQGRLWITGYTRSNDIPTTPDNYQGVYGGDTDAFLMQIDLTREGFDILRYSTMFGGRGADVPYGITLDRAGRAVIAGYTLSEDLPLKDSPFPPKTSINLAEIFVAAIEPALGFPNAVVFSGIYGGTLTDMATGIASDARGNIYVAGNSVSPNLAVEEGNGKQNGAGVASGVLLRIRP